MSGLTPIATEERTSQFSSVASCPRADALQAVREVKRYASTPRRTQCLDRIAIANRPLGAKQSPQIPPPSQVREKNVGVTAKPHAAAGCYVIVL